MKRFSKPSLSPWQADHVLRSVSRKKSLIVKSRRHGKPQSINPDLTMKKILIYKIGLLFLAAGIALSVAFKEPHFYTLFSIGLFIIFLKFYNDISDKPLFNKWKIKQFLIFSISLIIISIIIDQIGLSLNYWTYPHYKTIYDAVLKYIFEWTFALTYYMIAFFIFLKLTKKFNSKISIILSLILLIPLGIFTSYINHFSNSWEILAMPITSYKIGKFFIIFQTIGTWLQTLIPFTIYKIVDFVKNPKAR